MEIIFNICCLVAFFITSSAVIRFWKSYKRTGISQFKYFSLAFFSLSLAFLLFSFPNLILFNPFWIQIDFILADIIFLGAELFLIPAILSLIKYSDRIQKTFLLIISSMIVVYVLLNIFFFAPAISLCSEGICYWKNGIFWLHSMLWAPITLGAGIIGASFLFGARKIKEQKLFWSSFLFGLMGILVSIAGILLWYFKFFNPSSKILIISGIIGDFGFLLAVIGSFLYQQSRETFVKKIT